MKTTMVILTTVEEQLAAGDDSPIDPEVVNLTQFEDRPPSPLFRNGSYRVPEDVVGWWSNPRIEDGRLVADIELDDRWRVGPDEVHLSFAGIHAGGQARLISVHARHRPKET